jgi:MFS family permease
MPPALVRDTDFQLLNVTAVVVQFTSFAVPLITPYFLIRMAGWDPVSSGALLTVWALGSLLGAALTPRLIAAMGARGAAFVAELLVCAGLAGMAAWSATPGMAVMLACLLCQGAGLGLFQVAYSDLVVASLPASSRGVAGSLTMVTRTIGLVLGASTWLWIVQAFENAVPPAGGSAQGQFLLAFGRVFGTAALVSGLCLSLEALRRRVRSRRAARSSPRSDGPAGPDR